MKENWTSRSFCLYGSDMDKPNYSVKRLSPWHPVCRESSMDWPGVEFGPLQQEASDKPPVPRKGTTTGNTLHSQDRFCRYFSSLSKISAVHVTAIAVIPTAKYLTKSVSYYGFFARVCLQSHSLHVTCPRSRPTMAHAEHAIWKRNSKPTNR